ncbi:His Kinase A (phospho-acceptor) domain-containing protein [Flavobacterium aquidurense]|uniref:GAF domain-containing sensor histidine kinase n=1 Tax=Flavobacterium frigidimaris TaxID=262320 RepID=UPI00089BEC6B|nr:ATP-binding protein [Flavobacterium frigidimaris]SDY70866.1 His Kinase A (phospho-acceptor) domain-containing protein [Flavobacterium aquidurense]
MLEENFKQDILNIQNISIVPTLLNVICQTTGMGFAAVARVTEDRWITCSVQDNVSFGLKPGDELQVKTTICDEIRQNHKAVIIDNVSEDDEFRNHHTPAMYGLQSYISVPIIRKDGSFFGTLCAIDPKPNELKTFKTREMFNLFSELISFHITSIEEANENKIILKEKNTLLEKTVVEKQEVEKIKTNIEQTLIEKNISLEKMNSELEAFNYISSHDLQEPLRKIQLFTDIIELEETQNLSQKGLNAFNKIRSSAFRMQNLINDLLIYSKTKFDERKFEVKNLNTIVDEVIEDLSEEIESKNVTFEIQNLGTLSIIEFQFRQLLYNLISNSLKFSLPDKNLIISIAGKIINGSELLLDNLSANTKYYNITLSDNGIGFDQAHSEKIFGLFQALHTKPLKSTGIGLTIVKRIVENHNGFIKAEGALNEGAKFEIFIPIE